MNDEAARLAARFEEYANDPASVSIPSRQECLDASTILRAIPPIGTQAPIQVRELKRELRISSDHDYRPWLEIQEALKRLTPPALVAQREALKAILRHATAPKRMASERLDNIEALARAALATPATDKLSPEDEAVLFATGHLPEDF